MTKYFQKPFFRKLFLSYTAILLACSLVFSSILFQQILRQERSVQEQQCRSDAQLLMQVVDDKFTEIENIGTQLASAQWFQKVRSQSEILNSSITVLERRDICQELQTYYSILQVADSIALLLPEKEQAVDRVSFWEEERYFSSIGLEEDLIDEETEKALVESYKSMLLVPGENGSFYVFKQLNYGTEPDSVLFCLINASWFQQFLSQRFADSLGSLEIISDGEVVFSMTQEGESPDQWQRFELDSNLYQWTYSIAIQPPQTAFAGQGLMLGSLLLLVLLVGGALALFLARASYAPLFQLMQRLNLIETQENEQEFQALEHVFQDLGKQNRDLEQISTQYYNTMRTNLISSLLAGAFSEERIAQQLPLFGLDFQEEMEYLVGVLEYVDAASPEQKAVDYMQLNTFCQERQIAAQWMESMDQQLVGIFTSAKGSGSLFEGANLVRDYCASHFGQDVGFSCGLPQKGLSGIGKSYQEARSHSQEDEAQTSYYYPLEMELQLINQLKLGSQDGARKILEELREENLSRPLNGEDSRRAAMLVLETLLRAASDMKLEVPNAREEFSQILSSGDGTWAWDYLAGTVDLICDELRRQDEMSSQKIGPQLIAYVREHYCDSSLSQQQLSSLFHISRSMVSKVFKNTAKVNFIDYLHLLRVQKAKEYFDAGERDVLAVAKKTGYENETTFKRAFLRVESITPRKYVQQIGKR